MNATTSDVSVETTTTEDATPLSLAAWRIVGRHFPEALYWMRLEEPFDTLDSCPWDVLRVIVAGHCLGSGTPTQAELAFHTGFCVRSVRQGIAELRRHELLSDAPAKLDIGPRLTAFLREFTFARDPHLWRWTSSVIAVANDAPIPAPHAAEHVEPQAPRAYSDETPAPHAARIADDPAPHASRIADDPAPRAAEHAEPQAPRAYSDETPAPHAARIPDDPAPRAAEHAVPQAPRAAPDTTPAPHAAVARPTGHDDSHGPTPFRAAIPASLQGIRVSDGVASTLEPKAPPRAGRSEDPPSLIKKNKDLTSCSSEGGPTPVTPTAPTTAHRVDAATARRLALDALAARFQRANPGIPLPRACDAGDVMLVEACTAGGTWDVETLRQTHLDAIEGAFQKAPADRPPTPKYIWGQLRFFLAHAAIGRAKRLQAAAAPKPKKERPPEDPPASSEWLAQHMREARTRLDVLPAFSKPKAQLRFGEDTE